MRSTRTSARPTRRTSPAASSAGSELGRFWPTTEALAAAASGARAERGPSRSHPRGRPRRAPDGGAVRAAAPPTRTRAGAAAAAAAAVVALAVGLWAAHLSSQLDDSRSALDRERANAAVLVDPESRTVALQTGTGKLVVDPEGRSVLVLGGLEAAPAGKTYELWIMPGGNVDKAARAGLFPGREGASVVGVDGTVQSGDVVGVTVESAGGVDAPRALRSSPPSPPEPFLCERNRAAKLESTPLRVRKEKAVPRRRRRVRKRRLAALLLVLVVAAALSFTFGLVRGGRQRDPDARPERAALGGRQRRLRDRTARASSRCCAATRAACSSARTTSRRSWSQAERLGRGRALLRAPRRRRARHRRGRSGRTPARRASRGRLDDHTTVRQERVHPQRADVRAEDPRGGARLAARAALEQEPRPHRIPEHHLLRPRRLRGSSRRARAYFETAQSDSRLPEAALLAGIPADPSLYDPAANPDARLRTASRARAHVRAGEDQAPSARCVGTGSTASHPPTTSASLGRAAPLPTSSTT